MSVRPIAGVYFKDKKSRKYDELSESRPKPLKPEIYLWSRKIAVWPLDKTDSLTVLYEV